MDSPICTFCGTEGHTFRTCPEIDQEQAVAAILIEELTEEHPEVIAYYLATPAADRDFVWIEEAASAYLEDFGDGCTAEAHRRTCGIVFRWLAGAHGIEPPRWFTEGEVK